MAIKLLVTDAIQPARWSLDSGALARHPHALQNAETNRSEVEKCVMMETLSTVMDAATVAKLKTAGVATPT